MVEEECRRESKMRERVMHFGHARSVPPNPVILSGAPRGCGGGGKQRGVRGVWGGAQSKDLSLFPFGRPADRGD